MGQASAIAGNHRRCWHVRGWLEYSLRQAGVCWPGLVEDLADQTAEQAAAAAFGTRRGWPAELVRVRRLGRRRLVHVALQQAVAERGHHDWPAQHIGRHERAHRQALQPVAIHPEQQVPAE